MTMIMQPFESHIPYLLHFLGDYNLAGCGWIHFENFRENTKISELRDVDIFAQDIIIGNESGSSQININSLQELQIQDAATRRDLGIDEYKMTLGEPEDMGIQWENHERMYSSLLSRLREVNSSKRNTPFTGSQFPPSTSTTSQRSSQKTQSSQLKPIPENRTSFSERSIVEEYSLTAATVSQQDDQDAYSRAYSQIQQTSKWLNLETVGHVANSCKAYLDGLFTKVLLVPAPQTSEVIDTVGLHHSPRPYYGNRSDVPLFPFTHGGKEFKLKGKCPSCLPPFKFSSDMIGNPLQAYINDFDGINAKEETVFQLGTLPPSRKEVIEWQNAGRTPLHDKISGSAHKIPSMDSITHEDELSIMCLEVFATVRPGQTPFAETDPIEGVFWKMGNTTGTITTAENIKDSLFAISELDLIEKLISTVKQQDPDLLCGYETNTFSWGYVAERYTELTEEILDVGRLKPGNSFTRTDPILHPGRYLINLWQVLRHEVNLPKYTLEVAVHKVFHKRTPQYSFDDLYNWWESDPELVVNYFRSRIKLTLDLINHLELISKFSEQARIIGIDFYSCITRGSQYKVESVLYRLCKRGNLRLVSPSREQVGKQAALEKIPLVMEPKSDVYTDPVCVLDFRSLYPSIIIAFNLCYSTCIGRLELWKGENKLGILPDLKVPAGLTPEDIFISSNGIGFVKPHIRRSTLATMLKEILESRFMVKNSMKYKKDDPRYQRNMNSRQLALKFIANVTYGYVSASFSGRMPCAEIADAIVSIGRELLVKSIELIESQTRWGIKPKVVYGDTDSLFVQLAGASKDQAFMIGNELAKIVTEQFPSPIELELEKIYQPCILLTKKRYVGLSYDSPSSEAKFDAKGTETIRRDGTPIESRLEKGALELLFDGMDLSRVKEYLQHEWRKILDGDINMQEFCFSQQVKLGNYSANPSNLPPGAVISLKRAAVDKGSVPQYKERVSYIITNGLGNINERAVPPEKIVKDPDLRIDSQYYILKNIIPPLERLFNIFGANVRSWYTEMPKPNRFNNSVYKAQCSVCHGRSDFPLCTACSVNGAESLYILQTRENIQQNEQLQYESRCLDCSGRLGSRSCISEDCSVYYGRELARGELKAVKNETRKARIYLESLDF